MTTPFSTVGEALPWGTAVLREQAVPTPELEAEILLAHVLGVRREALLPERTQRLAPGVRRRYADLIAKRATRTPLQYLTGRQEFWSLPFIVDEHVLIPRPESEGIIEAVLERVTPAAAQRFLDVGTGSGNLAVTLAVALPSAVIYASDISWDALQVAAQNASYHRVQDRVVFLQGDLLALFKPEPTFDVIVSNPPYVSEDELAALEPEVREYEPREALICEGDGLDCYRRILPGARRRTKQGGWFFGELPYGKADAVSALAVESGWEVEGIEDDLQQIPRVLICRR